MNKALKHCLEYWNSIGDLTFTALLVAMGFLVFVAIETGAMLYWTASLSDFVNLYIALTLYYIMTGGGLIFAILVGLVAFGKLHKWYLAYAVTILMYLISTMLVEAIVDALPQQINHLFDLIQQGRR
jgi:hypothetical protein|tara:strand:+ start:129 stop:509 length:381 start_codon:yes stop_codon:yes gene_type:complete